MNHLDFLDTATRLIAKDAPTEADIRTIVSRSYYAVYHHVLSWWRDNELFPDYKDRGHAKIQMAFDRLDKTALSEGILNYLQRTNQI